MKEEIEKLKLKYEANQKQIQAELDYYREQIRILDAQDILLNIIIKDLFFTKRNAETEEIKEIENDG